jgi:K+-transporting ATPase KdpF subunit
MDWEFTLSGIVAIALLLYLAYSIVRPEKF